MGGEIPQQFQHDDAAGQVVMHTGREIHAVVMPAEGDDFAGLVRAGNGRTISAAEAARMFSTGTAPNGSVSVSRSLQRFRSLSLSRSIVRPVKVRIAAASALRSFS